jgi:hypothetical protein
MWSITVSGGYVAVTQVLIRFQGAFVAVVGPGSMLTAAVGVGVGVTSAGVIVGSVFDGSEDGTVAVATGDEF